MAKISWIYKYAGFSDRWSHIKVKYPYHVYTVDNAHGEDISYHLFSMITQIVYNSFCHIPSCYTQNSSLKFII